MDPCVYACANEQMHARLRMYVLTSVAVAAPIGVITLAPTRAHLVFSIAYLTQGAVHLIFEGDIECIPTRIDNVVM